MLMGTDRKRRLLPVTVRPSVNIAFQSGVGGVEGNCELWCCYNLLG